MIKTWNVTIFIDEDQTAAHAHARLTGGNALGHVVGSGTSRPTPTAVQDAAQRAVVRALEDLVEQLDHYMGPTPGREDRIRQRGPRPLPADVFSDVRVSVCRSA